MAVSTNQTTNSFLDQFFDNLESLPIDIQRHFRLMKELDKWSESLKEEIKKRCEDFLIEVDDLSVSDRMKNLKGINTCYKKLKEYANEKCDLARQIYDTVDKHIRHLDAELLAHDRATEQVTNENSLDSTKDSRSGRSTNKKRRKRGRPGVDLDKRDPKSPKQAIKSNGIVGPFVQLEGPDVLDMPVDPNEPTYCICGQVSYGEMIGCDNQDVSNPKF